MQPGALTPADSASSHVAGIGAPAIASSLGRGKRPDDFVREVVSKHFDISFQITRKKQPSFRFYVTSPVYAPT